MARRNRDREYVDARSKYATVNVQPPAINAEPAEGKLTIDAMEKMLQNIAADLSPRGTYRTIVTNGTGVAAPQWLNEELLPKVTKAKRRAPRIDRAATTDCSTGHTYAYPHLIGLHVCDVCGHQMVRTA